MGWDPSLDSGNPMGADPFKPSQDQFVSRSRQKSTVIVPNKKICDTPLKITLSVAFIN